MVNETEVTGPEAPAKRTDETLPLPDVMPDRPYAVYQRLVDSDDRHRIHRVLVLDGKPEWLGLPATLPDGANVFQTISVIDDMNNDCKIHVELADIMEAAESWGYYLAEVARAIARDHANYLETDREDGDLFADICNGFNRCLKNQSAK